MFVVGQAGKIFHYSNGVWVQETTGETRDLNAVYGFSATSVFAVADTNRAIYYYAGSWAKRSSDNLNNGLYSVWGTDPYNSFASGKLSIFSIFLNYYYNVININMSNSPNIARTDSSGIKGDRFGIWGSAENDVYMVGAPAETCSTTSCSGPASTISHYNGSSWSPVATENASSTLYAIWGTSATDVWPACSGLATGSGPGSAGVRIRKTNSIGFACRAGSRCLQGSPNSHFQSAIRVPHGNTFFAIMLARAL